MAENSIKNMEYDEMDARGLLMNILGHDIIHDYGPKSSSTRWKHVDEIINLFIFKNTNVQTGGAEDSSENDLPTSNNTSPSSSYQNNQGYTSGESFSEGDPPNFGNTSPSSTTGESSGDERSNYNTFQPIQSTGPPTPFQGDDELSSQNVFEEDDNKLTIKTNLNESETFKSIKGRSQTPFQRFTFPSTFGSSSEDDLSKSGNTSPEYRLESSPESSPKSSPSSSPSSSPRSSPTSSPSSKSNIMKVLPKKDLSISLFPSMDNNKNKQTGELQSSEYDTELTFDAMMDYIKQEIQIKIFLYKMEHSFYTDGEQTGGNKMPSVFDIFSDTYKLLLSWFIQGANESDESNMDENNVSDSDNMSEDKTLTENDEISYDNDIYQLYNFIAALSEEPNQPNDESTITDNNSKEQKEVELYDALFEDKFMIDDNHDVKSFKTYFKDMNIPFTREEFAIDAFINSDDHKFIVRKLSKGRTRSGATYRRPETNESENNIDLSLVDDDDDVESSLRRSSRIRNNRINNIIKAAIAEKAAKQAEAEAKAAAEAKAKAAAAKAAAAAAAAADAKAAAAADAKAAAGAGDNSDDTSKKTKLSSQTTIFRQQLIKFVANTALHLYGDKQTSDGGIYNIERDILVKVTDVKENFETYDEELKTNIEEYFNSNKQPNMKKLELDELCQPSTNKYIINNATFLMNKDNVLSHNRRKVQIPNDIENVIRAKNCVFCPVTSIIDAQSYCTLDKDKSLKEGAMEYGDMNFMIKGPNNTNISYNGILTLRKGEKSPYQQIVDLKVTIKSPKLNMSNLKFTNLRLYGKSDGNNLLSASFVLQQALQGLFAFFVSQSDNIKKQIKKNVNYLDNLYNLATNSKIPNDSFNYKSNTKYHFSGYPTDPSGNNLNALGVLFSKLIFKGCGDLFQEINAVCAYGGYDFDNPKYETQEGSVVQQWSRGNQNTQRLILSNDRPSAARAMIMLARATTSSVNNLGQAGFLNNEGYMFAIKYDASASALGQRERDPESDARKKARTGTGGAATRRRKSRRKRITIKRNKIYKRRTRKQNRKHKRTRNRKT